MCGIDVARRDGITYVFIYTAELELDNHSFAERLERYELVDNNTKLSNPKILLDIPISSSKGEHHGGKVLVGADGNLYTLVGEIDGRTQKLKTLSMALILMDQVLYLP
jgi:glucose/arabinose dehydrogenase